jgi:putative ABC transport system permease protein
MFRLSLKSVLARKGRLVSTSVSILIGIAFLAGTFVFTDTIKHTFDGLFATVYEKTDAVARSSASIDLGINGGAQRGRIPAAVVDDIKAVPGVNQASGYVQGYARILDKSGKPLGRQLGPPTFGSSIDDSATSAWTIAPGRLPKGPSEVVLDRGSAKDGGFALGQPVTIVSQGGTETFTLVGVARFGGVDSPGGSTFAMFDLPTAESFVGQNGQLDQVLVKADPGISQAAIARRLRTAVPSGVEVLTGRAAAKSLSNQVEEGLNFFNTLLLVFAGVGLFVGAFIIYNTFSIVVAQRARETALLRAIGASRRQVIGSVMLESVVVGLLASIAGFVAGVGMALVLKVVLEALGIDLPAGGLVVLPRTAVVALAVGVVVTVVSAVMPAVHASRVPPVAAMRDVAVDRSGFSTRRLVSGVIVSALGAGALAVGLSGQPALLGLGIALLFVGVFVLGPLIARPVARWLGSPLPSIEGMTGTLARENAARNPTRTARTAAALMVGVALVASISVLSASIRSSVRSIISQQFTGDFVVTSNQIGPGGLPLAMEQQLGQLPEVGAATGVQTGAGKVDGKAEALTVVDPDGASQLFDLDFAKGELDGFTTNGLLVSKSRADSMNLSLGSTVTLSFLNGSSQTVTVEGIYQRDQLAGPFTISRALWATSGVDQYDTSIYVKKAASASDGATEHAIQQVVDQFKVGDVASRTQYSDSQSASIDPFVNLVYGLLGLAVVIAVIGIANTLSLSVYERTRELGLLRAVGATRRQVRAMVRWESVITALLGTVQGISIGIVLGYAVTRALRSDGLDQFSLPVASLVVVVALAMICGIVAAIRPARRAAKLDVLDAIAVE